MTGSDRGEHSGSDDARTDVFLVQLDELVNTEDIGARLPVPGDLHAVLDEAQVTIRRLRARVAELETAGDDMADRFKRKVGFVPMAWRAVRGDRR